METPEDHPTPIDAIDVFISPERKIAHIIGLWEDGILIGRLRIALGPGQLRDLAYQLNEGADLLDAFWPTPQAPIGTTCTNWPHRVARLVARLVK